MPPEVMMEVQIYSGRQNPQFRISAAEATHLVSELAKLHSPCERPSSGDLGYRGLRVTGLPHHISATLSLGCATIERPGQPLERLIDPGREVEVEMLKIATRRLKGKNRDLSDYLLGILQQRE